MLSVANAVIELLPHAQIVHDKFHISKHLNEAVDQVRRHEHKELLKQGDIRLTGSKYGWLANEESVTDALAAQLEQLKHSDLKVARAWAIKEHFRGFWDYRHAGWAKRHFERWYSWAIRSRLEPIKKKIQNAQIVFAEYLELLQASDQQWRGGGSEFKDPDG